MKTEELLKELAEAAVDIFRENLVGVYLHGSLAMGCFNPVKSDIDILYVVEDTPSDGEKYKFMEETVRLNGYAPEKGIEMSVVRAGVLKPFVHPTPFELHFSLGHIDRYRRDPRDYIAKMQGDDPDLAAHAMITKHYGKVLFGRSIEEVFGPVAREYYLDSIKADIADAREDILRDPVYIILNLCRVLAYIRQELCLSKEQGGLWGIENLPVCYGNTVKKALDAYKNDGELEGSREEALSFAEYMLREIQI